MIMNTYLSRTLAFNEQLSSRGITLHNEASLRGKSPDGIIVVGMGGSGLIANILQNLAGYVNIRLPVISWKDFGTPPYVHFVNPLYIFISFSGDTKETISSLHALLAESRRHMISIVTGGGALQKLSEEHRIPTALFSQGELQPRQATGLMLYAALSILRVIFPSLLVPDFSNRVQPSMYIKDARAIAKKIGKKQILIYSSGALSHISYFWKAHVNETGKSLCFTNVIPELDHNEIVGFESKPKNTIVLFLESAHDTPSVKNLIPLLAHVLKKFGVPSHRIMVSGEDVMLETLNSLTLGSLVAYFISEHTHQDPEKTQIINFIKKQM